MTALKVTVNPPDKGATISDLEKAYESVFSGMGGVMVLTDLLTTCGAFSVNQPIDPLLMAFNEGRRAIGLHILKMRGSLTYKEMEVSCQKNL